ncbi:MAG: extracellular solute-binding protein [Defluviitaleaceae bacterium]|nr:extracellular solute-binding protein [Defluviitaleaceae bacterium]
MRKVLVLLLAIAALAIGLAACGRDPAAGAAEGAATIEMMFWGGLDEMNAMNAVIDDFNAQNEGRVYVVSGHVPADFVAVMNTRLAAGDPPDIAYTSAGNFYTMASEGHFHAVDDLMDPGFLSTVVHDAVWRYDGRIYGLSTAQVNLGVFYNADIFNRYGVERPPHNFSDALSWDEFVNLAQRVTVDRAGNNALSPDFNPNQIATFGFHPGPAGLNNFSLFAYSNGARLVNAAGTDTDFDSPEWIDTLYRLNRLVHYYRVTPSPAEVEGFPENALMNGAFAMTIDGRWAMMWLATLDFELGCAVMPDLGHGPFTMSPPGVTSIFAGTDHPELAWEFWEFKMDVENGATELYAGGLWQPIVHDPWYTDPASLAVWTDNDAHPPSFRGAFLDMALRPSQVVPLSSSYVRRVGEITQFVTPAFQNIMGTEMTRDEVAEVMRELQQTITENEAFHGIYNSANLLPRR